MGEEISGRTKRLRRIEKVEGLLFDVGGTLYVSDQLDKQFSREIEKVLARVERVSVDEARILLKDKIRELSETEGDPSRVRAMAAFGVSREQVHEAFGEVKPKLFLKANPKLKEMLVRLKRNGRRLAYLSNFRNELVEEILIALGLTEPNELFEFHITENDKLPIKPAPDPFLKAIEMFGLPKSRIAYVGDNLEKDMIPAKGVGMCTVWICGDKLAKIPSCVDVRLNNIIDLESVLGGHKRADD